MSDEDPQVTNLTVSGGAGSAEANLEDLLTLARQREGLAAELEAQATQVAAVAADSDLDAAAFFDPIGVGIVRDMLNEALTGPTGLFTMSTVMGDQARQVQAVHDYTVESDATQADLMQGVMWGLGRTGLAVPGMAADVFLQSLFDEVGGIFDDDPPPTSFDEDPQAWLLAHPGFINRWGEALPGLIGLPPGFQNSALIISSKWPDGRPVAALNPDPDPTTLPTQAPADLGDLMTNLAGRNRQATATHDEIDIQQITQADGTIAYIVNIPGTKTLTPPPFGSMSPYANDMVTNLYGVAGQQTTREEAIALALEDAHVPHDAPIMLVGHSQGGILAAQAAADSGNGTFDYNVTHVVTAASPVALADIPDDVQVLSLENREDLIPQTDAADNPSTANHTTVSFDYDTGTMGGNHALDTGYQQAADMLDAQTSLTTSADPSVAAFMDSASAFFDDGSGNTQIATQAYVLQREP